MHNDEDRKNGLKEKKCLSDEEFHRNKRGFLTYSTPAINPAVGATSVPVYKAEIALTGAFVALPLLIVFLLSQKRLIRGMLAGSIKK